MTHRGARGACPGLQPVQHQERASDTCEEDAYEVPGLNALPGLTLPPLRHCLVQRKAT